MLSEFQNHLSFSNEISCESMAALPATGGAQWT
jgi:hypothetical protein